MSLFADWGFSSVFPSVSICICATATCSQFAQVGPIGNAWVAGETSSSLDGHSNAGKTDIFLMKFRAPRLRLRGSRSTEFGLRVNFFSCRQEHLQVEKIQVPVSVCFFVCLRDLRSEVHPHTMFNPESACEGFFVKKQPSYTSSHLHIC